MFLFQAVIFYTIALILIAISFWVDKKKTITALEKTLNEFRKIAGFFLLIIILVSLSLFFFSKERLMEFIGTSSDFKSVLVSALVGSIAAIPGFIAFPLASVFRKMNVSWSVIAAFTNSLMLVGVLTFPLEKKYLGTKLALIRNIVSFVITIIIALIIGLIL